MPAGKTGGNWLYKQQDLLLGPVPFETLLEQLYGGSIDGATPVSPHGGELQFRPLAEVDAFRVHLAKAQAKLKVEAQHQEQTRTHRRRGLLKIAIFGTLALALVFATWNLAQWLAIHRPWESRFQIPEPMITDELPTISLASSRESEEELAYPGSVGPGKPVASSKGPRRPSGSASKPARPATKPSGLTARRPDSDDVESVQMWDQEAINRIVAANKKSLHPCLAAEAKRQKAGWSTRVPLEFTIGNNGRVTKLWIDNPEFKSDQSELFRCMLGELRKWRFPSYEGEQANVSLAFSIRAQ